jgi:hypothetical protein
MTATYTIMKTATRTHSRLDLLSFQVTAQLRRTIEWDAQTQFVVDEGLRRHWIDRFSVYAIDRSGRAWAHLFLKIDWRAHRLQIDAGYETVTLGANWIGGVAVEVEEAVRYFNRYFNRYAARWSLRKIHQYRFAPGVDVAYAGRTLGTVPALAPPWAGLPDGTTLRLDQLEEAQVGLAMIEPEDEQLASQDKEGR